MKRDLKSQLHLKVLVPLVAVAIAGLAVFQLGLIDRLTGGDEAEAAEPVMTEPAAPATEPAPEEPAAEQGLKSASKPTGMDEIEKALKKNRYVIVLLYIPNGQVDALATTEARLGAEDAGAGFVALDASKERVIRDVVQAYDIRTTPSTLLMTGGPNLANMVEGYADRQTVAQLVEDARRSS